MVSASAHWSYTGGGLWQEGSLKRGTTVHGTDGNTSAY